VKLVFFGTPECAVPFLQRVAAEHEVLAVVTQPDRPQGRGRRVEASPVKQAALALGLPVLQPRRVRAASVCALPPLQEAEAFVVVAYGQILSRNLCSQPDRPVLNVHFSLLPDLRGSAPVQRALLGGRQTTGVTIQYVAEAVDSGDVVLQQEVPIAPQDDAGALFAHLTEVGQDLLSQALYLVERGAAVGVPQDESRATLAPPLRPEEAAVDWTRPAVEISNQIRAFSPQPGAYCSYQSLRLKLFSPRTEESAIGAEPGEILAVTTEGLLVQAGEGAVLVGEVQPAGKRRMPAAAFARGARWESGTILHSGAQ
jgi:methionyl-tRNA formyltransferase